MRRINERHMLAAAKMAAPRLGVLPASPKEPARGDVNDGKETGENQCSEAVSNQLFDEAFVSWKQGNSPAYLTMRGRVSGPFY